MLQLILLDTLPTHNFGKLFILHLTNRHLIVDFKLLSLEKKILFSDSSKFSSTPHEC